MAKVIDPVEEFNKELRRREKDRKKAAKAAAKGEPPPPPTPPGGTPRRKWTDTPLAAEVRQIVKKGTPADFAKWFNELPLERLKAMMADRDDDEKAVHGARELIEKHVRLGPQGEGAAHEWLKCSQLVKVKEWGLKMEDIWATAEPTRYVGGDRWTHPTSGDPGKGSIKAHEEMDALFESSKSKEEFLTKLNQWADGKSMTSDKYGEARLFHGRYSLPEGLQVTKEFRP